MSSLDFLNNETTVAHLEQLRVLFLLCGPPSSSSVDIARKIKETFPSTVILDVEDLLACKTELRADDGKLLKKFHKCCLEATKELISKSTNHILVDVISGSLKRCFIKTYFKLAKQSGYITIMLNHGNYELKEHQKNKESPEKELENVSGRKVIYPTYWGWFFNDCKIKEFETLTNLAQWCLKLCLDNFPDFKEYMKSQFKGLEFSQIYPRGSPYLPGRQLHCTAFYGGPDGWKSPVVRAYASSKPVLDSLNCTTALHIGGVILTPKTAGCRVVLTPEQMKVWKNDEDVAQNVRCSADNDDDDDDDDDSDVDDDFVLVDEHMMSLCLKPDETGTDRSIELVSESAAEPLPSGSKAHITIGCAEGIQPVQTGLDQIEVLQRYYNGEYIAKITTTGMELIHYGNGRCSAFFVKDQNLPSEAIFTTSY